MRARTLVVLDFCAAALCVVLLALLIHVASQTAMPLSFRTQLEQGEKIYVERCVSCHATNVVAVRNRTDDELIAAIKKEKKHAAFRKQVSGFDLDKVILYMRTLGR